MASRLKLARGAAAVIGASVLLLLSALPAGADAATGKVDGPSTEGYRVNVSDRDHTLSTSLIGFELADGTRLQVYCVEINTSIDREHEMVEVPWDAYPNEDSPFHGNRDKINWVLHNGFPAVGTEDIAGALDGKTSFHDGLSEKEAITATQLAAWHYSDGINLDEQNAIEADQNSAEDVIGLYNYLTSDANTGIGDQPTPALEISPSDATGDAGGLVGPFTVSTTGEIDELTKDVPDGVTVTDKDGKALSAADIKNRTEVFFKVPASAAEGEGTFSLTASAHVDTGRLFVGKEYDKRPTQSLIVAKADKSDVAATAKGSWKAASQTPTSAPTTTQETTPAPTTTSEAPAPAPQAKNTGGLASTGASILVPVLIGAVLVGAGVGAIVLQRRRRA